MFNCGRVFAGLGVGLGVSVLDGSGGSSSASAVAAERQRDNAPIARTMISQEVREEAGKNEANLRLVPVTRPLAKAIAFIRCLIGK